MPIYEYDCQRCRRPFETLVMSASEAVACPGCGSARVEKRFSVFGVGASSKTQDCGAGACGAPDPGECPPSGCGMGGCSQLD